MPPPKATKDSTSKPMRRMRNDKAPNHWSDLKDLKNQRTRTWTHASMQQQLKPHKQVAVSTIPKRAAIKANQQWIPRADVISRGRLRSTGPLFWLRLLQETRSQHPMQKEAADSDSDRGAEMCGEAASRDEQEQSRNKQALHPSAVKKAMGRPMGQAMGKLRCLMGFPFGCWFPKTPECCWCRQSWATLAHLEPTRCSPGLFGRRAGWPH